MAAALAALLLPASPEQPTAGCANRNNNTYEKLLECMTLEGVREHQAALQAIADANGGTRAAGTPGYDASVDYVVDDAQGGRLDGLDPLFDFTVAQPIQQLTPAPAVDARVGRRARAAPWER